MWLLVTAIGTSHSHQRYFEQVIVAEVELLGSSGDDWQSIINPLLMLLTPLRRCKGVLFVLATSQHSEPSIMK